MKLKRFFAVALTVFLSLTFAAPTMAAEKKEFVLGTSDYVWWYPIQYMEHAGILAKHAKANGITVKVLKFANYVESVNALSKRQLDAVAVTNVDAITILASGGVPVHMIDFGDYSNDNDGIVVHGKATVCGLKGRDVLLEAGSVSEFVGWKALRQSNCGFTLADVSLRNTSSQYILSAFGADKNVAAITWNPPLMEAKLLPDVGTKGMIFGSSQMPGYILDGIGVLFDAPDTLRRTIVGAWYETMRIFLTPGKAQDEAVAFMAEEFAQTSPAAFRQQMATTKMFLTPAEALAFIENPVLKEVMAEVIEFTFERELNGNIGAPEDIGIKYPDGTIVGNPKNIVLTFDTRWTKLAKDGGLKY